MADKTLFNYQVDITLAFGDLAASYEPAYDLGVKYMFRAFMVYSSLNQPVTIKFDNDGSFGDWNEWSASQTYNRAAIVQDSAGDAYQSLVNANLNHEPASSPSWWQPFSPELNIPGLAEGWKEAHNNFRHNDVVLIKHNGVAPTAGFIKIVSWRAE